MKFRQFIKKNKVTILQLAVLAAAIGVDSSGVLANSSSTDFKAITDPLEKFQAAMTGPIPKVIGTAGIGILGISTAMSFENQVTKRAIQMMGGVGAGLGATSLISVAGSSFVFM